MSEDGLVGRRVLVMGASAGIGRCIGQRLCAAGAHVAFASRRKDACEEAAKEAGGTAIGLSCYVESSGVAPSRFAGALGARVGFYEAASIRVEPDGAVRAMLGTHNPGQGHATTLAQILPCPWCWSVTKHAARITSAIAPIPNRGNACHNEIDSPSGTFVTS